MKFNLLVIIALLVALAGCGSGSNTPEGVVEELYALSKAGSLEGALELLVIEKRTQRERSMNALAKFRDDLNGRKFAELVLKGNNEEGNTMRVYLTETYENGQDMDGGAQLMLEEGEWKLKSLYVPGGVAGRGGHNL